MSDLQVPREAKLVSLLLSSSGINECEPKVIQQILEFMYRYSIDVLQDSMVFAEHAGRTELNLEDLRLGIKSQLKHMFVPPASRDFLMELAARKNSLPLPIFDDRAGIRLPPDHHTLLGASYKLTAMRKSNKPVPYQVPSTPLEDVYEQ